MPVGAKPLKRHSSGQLALLRVRNNYNIPSASRDSTGITQQGNRHCSTGGCTGTPTTVLRRWSPRRIWTGGGRRRPAYHPSLLRIYVVCVDDFGCSVKKTEQHPPGTTSPGGRRPARTSAPPSPPLQPKRRRVQTAFCGFWVPSPPS